MTTEPRVAVIEGRRTLIVERNPPLPESLALLLEGGRDSARRSWSPIRLTSRQPLRLMGARTACLGQDHRLVPWLEGFHTGSDLVTRFLHVHACADCGSVCVRDHSLDFLDGLPTGDQRRRRKDHVIAWYSGARPLNRTFGRSTQ
jgi:hypothetical protein